MIRRLTILLLIVGCLFAEAQLVKEAIFIPLEEGKLFSINSSKNKYKFQSIDFELQLINNSIDMKFIKTITFYNGNSAIEFGRIGFLGGIVTGLAASVGDTPPDELIINLGIFSMPTGMIGFCIGLFFHKKELYIISEDEWQFIP